MTANFYQTICCRSPENIITQKEPTVIKRAEYIIMAAVTASDPAIS
jgi:hypothetical protein